MGDLAQTPNDAPRGKEPRATTASKAELQKVRALRDLGATMDTEMRGTRDHLKTSCLPKRPAPMLNDPH